MPLLVACCVAGTTVLFVHKLIPGKIQHLLLFIGNSPKMFKIKEFVLIVIKHNQFILFRRKVVTAEGYQWMLNW